MAALKRISIVLCLVLGFVSTAGAQAPWWCVFNPLGVGCPPTAEGPKDDRTELCDTPVPDAFQLIYGRPPLGPGCLSKPDKVAYFTNVQTWVVGSEKIFEGESAALFEEFGFGKGLEFTKKWGAYERPLIAFPQPEWGFPIPIVFGPGASTWPAPYIARGQTDSVRAGACVAKLHPAVPGRIAKLNSANCSK